MIKINIHKYISFHKLLWILSMTILVLNLSSCAKKQDLIFDKSAQERELDIIRQCDETLLSSENGWQLDLTTGSNHKFRLQMKFLPNKQVKMYGDFLAEPIISSYRYTLVDGPVLNFDTYGLIHHLSDPIVTPEPGDKKGKGYMADFEFIIEKVEKDSIYCRGLKYKNKLVFGRLKQLPNVSVGILDSFFDKLNGKDYIFKTLRYGNEPLGDIYLDVSKQYYNSSTFISDIGSMTFVYLEDNKLKEKKYRLSKTETGFKVEPAILYKDKAYSAFVYDNDLNVFVAENDSQLRINLKDTKPAIIKPHIEDHIGHFYVMNGGKSDMPESLYNLTKGFDNIFDRYVEIQWYNGPRFYSITVYSKPGGKNRWQNVPVRLVPVDLSQNKFKLKTNLKKLSSDDTEMIAALKHKNNSFYTFLTYFTDIEDSNNTICIYEYGKDLIFVSQMDPSKWIYMRFIK